MKFKDSKIDLLAYQGNGLPSYMVDGYIKDDKIKAQLSYLDGEDVGKVVGVIGDLNYFFVQIHLKNCKYELLEISGRLTDDPSTFRVELDNKDRTCDIEGVFGESMSLEVMLYSLTDGVAGFLIGGSILPDY